MHFFGQEYSRRELLKRCNSDVLYRARRIELADGRGRGQKLVEVKTSAGLRASFSEDRCLDILELEYKGINLAFLSKNGIISSALTSPETDDFTKYCSGGFLFTCGLRNTGPSCCVDGEFFPLHGRIGITPAESVSVNVNEDEIVVSGSVRETALFGPCLEMSRKITIPSNGTKIVISDTIENLTPDTETILFLYHINFGFPFLSEELEVEFPKGEVRGRTPFAQENLERHTKISPPVDGEPEQVFFHLPDDRDAKVSLLNPKLGIRAIINYDTSNLPVLTQWKCMRSGDYALGIEPGTSFLHGRKEEIENGYDIQLPGFGSLKYGFTISLEERWM